MKQANENNQATTTANARTELVFILDKSGSMRGMEKDTIGGFNAMIDKQKKQEGEVLITTILFSNRSVFLHDRLNLQDVKPLEEKDYQVGGSTALYDAIGGAIKHVSTIHKYARPEDLPQHTLFVITTDGMENASKLFEKDEIKSMIKTQEETHRWEFLFLADNIDAVETAVQIGIEPDHAVDYCVSEDTDLAFMEIDDTIRHYRQSGAIPKYWSREIKRSNDKRKKRK